MAAPDALNLDTLDPEQVKAIAEQAITRLIGEMQNREEGPDEPRSKLEGEEEDLELALGIVKDHAI